jgi:hypothetical protein
MRILILTFLALLLFSGCEEKTFLLHYEHENLLFIDHSKLPENTARQNVYVPAYSDIYYETGNNRTYLTVILSVRNTSFYDTLYFDKIEYYSSGGKLLREYIDKILVLRPMESMEYIVRADEKKGGSGANFIVSYHTKENLKNPPLIESVMMGNLDNYRFSFTSRGVEIND